LWISALRFKKMANPTVAKLVPMDIQVALAVGIRAVSAIIRNDALERSPLSTRVWSDRFYHTDQKTR
jgi:hypothetical protein